MDNAKSEGSRTRGEWRPGPDFGLTTGDAAAEEREARKIQASDARGASADGIELRHTLLKSFFQKGMS
jgi:hypothetical protein